MFRRDTHDVSETQVIPCMNVIEDVCGPRRKYRHCLYPPNWVRGIKDSIGSRLKSERGFTTYGVPSGPRMHPVPLR